MRLMFWVARFQAKDGEEQDVTGLCNYPTAEGVAEEYHQLANDKVWLRSRGVKRGSKCTEAHIAEIEH